MLKKGNLFLSSLGNHLNFEIFVFKWRCSVNTNKALAILIIICISCGTWEFSGSLRNSSNCWAAVKRLSRSVSLVILLTRCDKREPSPNILICSESKTIIPSVHNKSSHKPCSPCSSRLHQFPEYEITARIPDPPLNGMVVPYKSPPRIWPSSRDSLIMCISTIALRQVQWE